MDDFQSTPGGFVVKAILKITNGNQKHLDGSDTITISLDSFVLTSILRPVFVVGSSRERRNLQTSMSQYAAVSVSPFPSAATCSRYKELNVAVSYNCTERQNGTHIPRFSSPSVSVRFMHFSLSVTLYCIVLCLFKYCLQSCSLQWDHFFLCGG